MPRNRSVSMKTLLLSMSVLAMAACSGGGSSNSSKADVPPPPVAEGAAQAVAQTHQATATTLQPLSASDTLTPIFPPVQNEATVAAAPAALAPASGASDIDARIARLEQAVGSLRSDYDRIMPAFASLNTTNERIQTLLDDMERENGVARPVAAIAPAPFVPAAAVAPLATNTTVAVTQQQTPVATTTTVVETKTVEPAVVTQTEAAPVAGGMNVSGLRIGEHDTKTRLVFDVTGKTKPDFKYDLDNGEKLLLVDLPSTGWAGAQSGKGGVSPLVEGWSVQKSASGGSTLAIQLKKDSRILSTQFLPSEGSNPSRLVMDIAADS